MYCSDYYERERLSTHTTGKELEKSQENTRANKRYEDASAETECA